MKEPARLIIPLWGEIYANKLVSITLPALLAPGNLPTFCTQFDVELMIVTEKRLFTFIEATPSFRRAATLCRCRFTSLDDVMTDTPGDYGVTLTYALFRGFTDLGLRMTLMTRILAVTTLVFFGPSLFLGMISPVVVKLTVSNLKTTGNVVGKIYAFSTLGSIAGTFATGFFLIAWLGTRALLFTTAAVSVCETTVGLVMM